MFDRWLIFTRNNARWLKLPAGHRPESAAWENAVKNPNVDRLMSKRVPMIYWKFTDGQVVEMSAFEKKLRDKNIATFGVDNVVQMPKRMQRAWNTREMMWFVLGWAIASSIAWGWLAFFAGGRQ